MSVVDEVKDRIDIVDVIAPHVALRKSGRGFTGLCPFHVEKTSSFYVYPDSWSFHCFGCGANGDGFNFLMRREGLSFSEALHRLAGQAGIVVPERVAARSSEDHSRQRDLLAAAERYFRECLSRQDAETARQYLAGRGLDQPTIEAFGIGYAPDGWDHALRYLTGLGYQSADLQGAGLVITREDGGGLYDRFRNRVIIPIRDREGRPVAFGARALSEDQKPKYLNSPETPLFTKGAMLYALDRAAKAIRDHDSVVIVEGYLDAITAHRSGFANVVASMGTSLTERQVRQLTRLTKRIVLALDADAAGQAATLRGLSVVQEAADERVVPQLTWHGYIRYVGQSDVDLRVLTLPVGKDPDDLIRRDPELWKRLVQNAVPVVEHLFSVVIGGLDRQDPAAKSRAAESLMPAIRALGDPIRQAHYVAKLASALGVDERTLLQVQGPKTAARRSPGSRTDDLGDAVNHSPTSGSKIAPRPNAVAQGINAERRLELYALALMDRFLDLDPDEAGLEERLFEGSLERDLFRLVSIPSAGKAGEVEPVGALRVDDGRLETVRAVNFPEMSFEEAKLALIDVARRLRERYLRKLILGGGAAAETPVHLEPAVDEGSRLLAVWKSRVQGEKRP